MRIIDADKLMKELAVDGDSTTVIVSAPIIKTKQIKYFDEDERVWKIGEVIVDEQIH